VVVGEGQWLDARISIVSGTGGRSCSGLETSLEEKGVGKRNEGGRQWWLASAVLLAGPPRSGSARQRATGKEERKQWRGRDGV
jgi:hypothetical protein